MPVLKPTVKFLVTPRCNIKCQFCHNEFQGNGRAAGRQLYDPSRTTALLRMASPSMEFGDLKLSGGEPLTFFKNLLLALSISEQFRFERRIVVTNLLAGTCEIFSALRSNGVTELRINLPSFAPETYAKRTGMTSRAFQTLRGKIELARSFSFHLRANIVVSDSTVDQVEADTLASMSPVRDLFDELFFIVDYRSTNKAELFERLLAIANATAWSNAGTRKGRITEFSGKGQKISVAQCTVGKTETASSVTQDLYIVPPGVLLTEFDAGYAFQ